MLASQRIIFNTSIMYAKTVLTLGITLYSTRIILNELGENDFGIYNVVAGVIAMLSFLTHAMSQSTRRYMSNAIGKKRHRTTCYHIQVQHKNSFDLGMCVCLAS